jgi:hypothetical protein
MVVSILVAIVFLADLAVKIPFSRASLVMDIALVVCSLLLAVISWLTLREQG